MKKIYLVTGGTGFVGNNLIKILTQKNENVVALVRNEEKVKKTGIKVPLVYGDVKETETFKRLFDSAKNIYGEGEYILVHTASVVRIGGTKKQYKEMALVNRLGADNAINACLENKCRLLYVSSVHAITEPKKRALTYEIENFDYKTVVGKYAKSKSKASAAVMFAAREKGLDAVLVHPAGIIGPNDFSDTHLTQMVVDYMDGKIPVATGGGYDFVDVRDVANGIIAAIERGKTGECFILANRYYSVRTVLNTLYEITGKKEIKKSVPNFIAKLGLPALLLYSKIFKKRPLYTLYSLYTLRSNSNFAHEKAASRLDYTPRDLKESLSDTVAFLNNK